MRFLSEAEYREIAKNQPKVTVDAVVDNFEELVDTMAGRNNSATYNACLMAAVVMAATNVISDHLTEFLRVYLEREE